jgi:hypothetical protein
MPESTVTTPSYTTPWDTITSSHTGGIESRYDIKIEPFFRSLLARIMQRFDRYTTHNAAFG